MLVMSSASPPSGVMARSQYIESRCKLSPIVNPEKTGKNDRFCGGTGRPMRFRITTAPLSQKRIFDLVLREQRNSARNTTDDAPTFTHP
jgi:hypothetical protein